MILAAGLDTVALASLQDKMGVHVFLCVSRRNLLPVTRVTRCLPGDLGGCFRWSLRLCWPV